MIPNPDVTSLKVKVVTAESKTMTKNLNMNSSKPKQIHFVKLPKINVKDLKFDYTIWLSQLDPNIYLSEIFVAGFRAVVQLSDVGHIQEDPDNGIERPVQCRCACVPVPCQYHRSDLFDRWRIHVGGYR